MPDKPLRPQLNVRLDKHPELLDEIKQAAGDRNISASEFILDAINSALGKPIDLSLNKNQKIMKCYSEFHSGNLCSHQVEIP